MLREVGCVNGLISVTVDRPAAESGRDNSCCVSTRHHRPTQLLDAHRPVCIYVDRPERQLMTINYLLLSREKIRRLARMHRAPAVVKTTHLSAIDRYGDISHSPIPPSTHSCSERSKPSERSRKNNVFYSLNGFFRFLIFGTFRGKAGYSEVDECDNNRLWREM